MHYYWLKRKYPWEYFELLAESASDRLPARPLRDLTRESLWIADLGGVGGFLAQVGAGLQAAVGQGDGFFHIAFRV